MDWKECSDRRIVKSVKPDEGMVKSLLKSSKNKTESEKLLEMSEVTAASKLSLAYDSLRELLEALAMKRGYKVYNHECYTAFLKEIMNESSRGDEFDDIRKARNSVNCCGEDMTPEDAKTYIGMITPLRNFILKLLEK